MKKQRFLTALILSIPFTVFSEGLSNNFPMVQILSGKMAYLEQNYQASFECLKELPTQLFDRKTYWQFCHSAFQSGNSESFIQLFEKSAPEDRPIFIEAYLEPLRVYQGHSPLKDQEAFSLKKQDWELMFRCIPKEQQLRYLDNLYTAQWLRYPSLRAFMLERLIQWGLHEDAYELATLNFESINEEWLKSCDLNFSYAQLQTIFQGIPQSENNMHLKAQWYKQAIAIYDGAFLGNTKMWQALKQTDFEGEALYGIARSLIRHDQKEYADRLCKKDRLSDDQRILLKVEHALSHKQLNKAHELLERMAESDHADYIFYRGLIAYYQKDCATALKHLNKIQDSNLNKEAIVLKACALCETDPKSVMPFMMGLYRKECMTHREMTIVQIHLLDSQGQTTQAQAVWMQLTEQEQSQLRGLKIFLNL